MESGGLIKLVSNEEAGVLEEVLTAGCLLTQEKRNPSASTSKGTFFNILILNYLVINALGIY